MTGDPDPSDPNRWIVTRETLAELGAYIVALQSDVESLLICIGEQNQ